MPKTANSIYESGSNLSLYNLSWLTTLEYFVNCFVYCLQGWRKLGGRGRGGGATGVAEQEAPLDSGGLPHYYLLTQIFSPGAIP